MATNKLARQKAFQKGVEAEKHVIKHLETQGFKLLNHRYKTTYGEIDLVMKRDNLVCFIEVKARKSISDGLFSITPKAQKRISNSALLWISENLDKTDCDYRFDAAIVTSDFQISYLEGAFEAQA